MLLPGLIDPHMHPGLIALLLACEWVTPEAWDLPGRQVPATHGRDAFLARLGELEAAQPAGEPLVVFGFHAQFHEEVWRADLDAISTGRPIVLWQRSFHELRCNTPALEWLDASEAAAWDPYIDLESGRMWESGMAFGLRTLSPHLVGGEKLGGRLAKVVGMVHRGGVTTIGDPGYGVLDLDHYLETLLSVHEGSDVPFRQYLIPAIGRYRMAYGPGFADTLADHESRGTDRIRFLHAGKFFADGAFIAQLMQVGPPGYIDGHEGAWMANPDRIADHLRPSWEEGRRIDVHVNGDRGLDAALDAIDRVGSARRNGMSVALHSDLPMGPLQPLLAASIMATRTSMSGEVLGPEERLTPEDALAAVTIEAAWQLRLDHEVGSLAAGKQADLVALADDPLDLDPADWPDIPIRATVLGGEVYTVG